MFDVVIVGAGPGGISLAVEAHNCGVPKEKILILEKAEEHSWSIRKYYPEKEEVTANYHGEAPTCNGVLCLTNSASKEDALTYLEKAIIDHGITVHYNEPVFKIQKVGDNDFEISTSKGVYKSKTCVIAIGILGSPEKPDYSIADIIDDRIHYDVNSHLMRDNKVLVVGGGDTASEFVQYLVQENNEVYLSYHRDSFDRMNDINAESLMALEKREKVKVLLNSNVSGVDFEEEKKVRVKFKEDNPDLVVNHIIYAMGGTTPKNFLSTLQIGFNGEEPHLTEGYETTIPGLFLVGDLAFGENGGSINSAFNSAHLAMKRICEQYLQA